MAKPALSANPGSGRSGGSRERALPGSGSESGGILPFPAPSPTASSRDEFTPPDPTHRAPMSSCACRTAAPGLERKSQTHSAADASGQLAVFAATKVSSDHRLPTWFVARHFPHKKTKQVSNGLAGQGTIRAFLRGLNLVFQRGKSEGLNAIYHFTFTGQEEVKATVVIHDKKVEVSDGHNGTPDFQLTADSNTWLRFLRKENSGLVSSPARLMTIPAESVPIRK
jgi:hypothetical protein